MERAADITDLLVRNIPLLPSPVSNPDPEHSQEDASIRDASLRTPMPYNITNITNTSWSDSNQSILDDGSSFIDDDGNDLGVEASVMPSLTQQLEAAATARLMQFAAEQEEPPSSSSPLQRLSPPRKRCRFVMDEADESEL